MRDARQKIATCQSACSSWSRKYEDEEEEGDYEEEELDNADDTDVENGNYDDEFYEDDEEESNINNNASKRISYNSNEGKTNIYGIVHEILNYNRKYPF